MVDILQTKTSIIKPKPQKQSQMKMRLTIPSIVKCHFYEILLFTILEYCTISQGFIFHVIICKFQNTVKVVISARGKFTLAMW